MDAICINRYKDRWVLTSARQVIGGLTLDAPPVRLIPAENHERLRSVIKELLTEQLPMIPQPPEQNRVGIRAEALGLKSWRAFVKDSRCFNLERREDGLLLEEWPKEGGSFSACAAWQKSFPLNGVEEVVAHLAHVTHATERPELGVRNRKPSARSRKKPAGAA